MLVSFNPIITNNNKSKAPSFKANPLVNTKEISSVAEAMLYEGLINAPSNKIAKTAEELLDLDYAIKQCYARGQKGVAFVLERVKKNL